MKQIIRYNYALQTDVGRERPHNEDGAAALNFVTSTNDSCISCGLFAVSDGMGGHNAGEIASMTAIRGLTSVVNNDFFQKMMKTEFFRLPEHVYNYHFKKKSRGPKLPQPSEVLNKAIQKANADIIDLSRRNPAFFGMGATLTAVLLVDRQLTVANVGDSRCYVIRKGTISQITRDHTIVNQMLELGTITREEAQFHPGRNFLYRSLGSDESIEMDLFEMELETPAWVLLCSDGLNNMITDDEILKIVGPSTSPQRAAGRLVKKANRAGGKDNISVLLVKVS